MTSPWPILIIKQLNTCTFKFNVKHVILNTNSKKVAYFAKQTSSVQNKKQCDDTCAPIININRVEQNKNLTYFTVAFSVISLTINKLILEICLESMQQTELQLKGLILLSLADRKCSQFSHPKNSSDHVTQHVGIQTQELNSLCWT